MSLVVAFSGGKDSTAMVLRLAELGEDFQLLFTPTGNELPDLHEHLAKIVARVGKTLITPANQTLDELIRFHKALPNFRMRWCTRQIKIVPCIVWLKRNPGSTLAVGLRADEEHREGLYGSYATYRYPLREWGWKLADVVGYLKQAGVTVPKRTDCALCYGQRLSEWFALWRDYPAEFAKGEAYEEMTGHTFRSPQRDTWPAPLVQLRARFEAGDRPRGVEKLDQDEQPCRVCRL
jgi:3'-phosphoadenosine 5'-phosphosulfate sulfotransferase (PAPS reductase)/FAD synthetase